MFREFLLSTFAFVKGIVAQYRWVMLSLIPGLGNVYKSLAFRFWPDWNLPFEIPWQVRFGVPGLAIVVSALITYHKSRMEMVKLERRLIRKVEFVHGDTYPFVQINSDGQVLRRVGVKNTSALTIAELIVRLREVRGVMIPGVPCRLHWMNDNAEPQSGYAQSIALNPSSDEYAGEYVDVVLIAPLRDRTDFFSAVRGVYPVLNPGTYEFIVEAFGTDCVPATAKFSFSFGGQSEPRLVRLA
jgi:hypothetical protein